ncbi:MAG TPA: phosphoadenosine phosphosulfate reductase family protein [Bacteroidales bacterium]|nr:phosphoadenosine phosphosulfate reductase family protein [Bacteroidales bacterium]
MCDFTKKITVAIERLKAFEPDEGYYLCYSGGKDSDVIRILAELANVKHDIHHNLTSVDAPETIRYIKSIPNINIDIPFDKLGNRVSMWSLIVKKGIPPTRLLRYCCSELKEKFGKGRLKVTGVRSAESINRAKNSGLVKIIGKSSFVSKAANNFHSDVFYSEKGGIIMNMDNDANRRLVEHCFRTTSTILNPIVDWSDDDVWRFLSYYNCSVNPLYSCNTRIGCIGCPLSGQKTMVSDFERYPNFKKLYIRAFDKMLDFHKEKEYTWETGQDVFDWWTGTDSNQLSFFDKQDEENII